MSDAELIYEAVKTLPEKRTAQILDFVKHIKEEEANKAEIDREVEEPYTAFDSDDSWFENGEPCPICARHRDPITGELRLKPEIMSGMQEVEDMILGKVPVKWFNSLDEMMITLDEDD